MKIKISSWNKTIPTILFWFFIILYAGSLQGTEQAAYLYLMTTMLLGVCAVSASDFLIVSQRLKGMIFSIGFFILSTPYLFRNLTGIDDYAYLNIFNKMQGISLAKYLQSGEEVGYLLLNVLVSKMTGHNYEIFQIVVGVLTFFFWGKAIWDMREFSDVTIATILFTSNFYLLIMPSALVRIFLASGIVFWSYKFLSKNQPKKYILGILFASLFHVSALIMLVLLLVQFDTKKLQNYWKKPLVRLFIALPAGFLFVGLVIAPMMSGRYSSYTNFGKLDILGSLDMLAIFIFAVYLSQYYEEKDRLQKNTMMMLLGMCVIVGVFAPMFNLGRIIYYTYGGVVMLAGSSCKIKKAFLGKSLLPTIFLAYSYMYIMTTSLSLGGNLRTYTLSYASIYDWINKLFQLSIVY